MAAGLVAGCEGVSPLGLQDAGQGADGGGTGLATTTVPVCSLIDFEDVDAGTSVSSVTALGVTFTISTSALGATSTGAAIYDSDTPVGADADLENDVGSGGRCDDCDGHMLILQEQGAAVPDDSDTGGTIRFTFDPQSGPITIERFSAIDQDITPVAEQIDFSVDGGAVLASSTVHEDGFVEDVDIDPDAVATGFFEFDYVGSGGVDDISVCREEPNGDGDGGQGCTPGFWKQDQHLDSWPDWDEDDPDDDTDDAFSEAFNACISETLQSPHAGEELCTKTLLQALDLGGGGLNALARHAVAALLNAAHPDVDYDLSVAEVQAEVNEALSGSFDSDGTDSVEETKDALVAFNEQGCPLN